MRLRIRLTVVATLFASSFLYGQTLTTIQPANGTTVVSPVNPGASDDGGASVLRALQAMKAANAEILLKQETTLTQLDETGKNMDQLRLFSRPGGMSR